MHRPLKHHLRSHPRATLFGIVLVCALLVGALFLRNHLVPPWQPSGTVSLFTYAVPEDEAQGETLGIGIYDITLLRENHSGFTLPNGAHTLLATPPDIHMLVNAEVPAGTYTGIRFSIRNLEVRNDWRSDGAPESLSLLHDSVTFPTPFTVHEDTTTIVLAGFETQRAIRVRDGNRVYLPTIALEIREHAPLQPDDATSAPHGGTTVQNATFGMSWDGSMKRNFRAEDYTEANTEPADTLVEQQLTGSTPSLTATTTAPEPAVATTTATTTEEAGVSTSTPEALETQDI
jgi:hypothetical protein